MISLLKRQSLLALIVVSWMGMLSQEGKAQDSQFIPFPWSSQVMIPGPGCLGYPQPWEPAWTGCSEAAHASWIADIRRWRDERRIRVGADDARYADPRVNWTHSAFMQAQAMVEDRYLYDPERSVYTVDRYLDDLKARFGGVDAVLLWPTYPNLGVDDRNQIDMLRAMPGGVPGVKRLVSDFHRRGVRVLFPFMLWDQSTRDPGEPWPQALTQIMSEVGADGMNGDTQDGAPLAFSLAADAKGHPLVFQPEGPPHDEALSWNLMSWGQYSFEFTPKVDRFRWLEPRHMVNISDRWSRTKTDDLQYAFFNGEGWESWENIWGTWNRITPRDGEATRRVATLERGVSSFLTSPQWEPFYPMARFGVFASRWPQGEATVFTIVNRNEYDVEGGQMTVPASPGARWFDLYHGVELTPAVHDNRALLSFPIEGKGYGAVLETHGEPDPALIDLIQSMKAMTSKPLQAYASAWTSLPQTLVAVDPTQLYANSPAGMIEIPGGVFDFKVRGVELEGGDQEGVDVAYPWETSPRRFHEHALRIKRFFIDRTPVTDADFKRFLDASGYHPHDPENFLKDWANGTYPPGSGDRPVTWVSIEDARAYARWAGKRLPHEWEWQYAAQGLDGRAYPWGEGWDGERVPATDLGRTLLAASAVEAHPEGASPLGVIDLVGNVWQWTDEYRDEHTRAAILRGGSHWRPKGSIWYFPQAYRNDEHGKLLLMAPGRDRSGAIGFRCAADAL